MESSVEEGLATWAGGPVAGLMKVRLDSGEEVKTIGKVTPLEDFCCQREQQVEK